MNFLSAYVVGGLVALTLVVRTAFLLYTHRVLEDAYITSRYAMNLVSGVGFYFNSGEHVMGLTCPLFGLMTAGGLALGFRDPALVQCAFGVIAAAGSVWLVATWPGLNRTTRVAASLLFALTPYLVEHDCSGMEVGVVVFMMLATVRLLHDDRDLWAGIVGAMLVPMRTDLGAFLVLVGVPLLLNRRRVPWVFSISVIAVCTAWVLAGWLFYGTLVPQSIAAKIGRAATVGQVLNAFGKTFLPWSGQSGSIATAFKGVLMCGWLIGAYIVVRRQRDLYVWFLYPFVVAVGAIFFGFNPQSWHLVSAHAPFLIVAGVGIGGAIMAVRRKLARTRVERIVEPALLVVLLVMLALGLAAKSRSIARDQRYFDEVPVPLAVWIRTNSEPAARVALEPIGYIGYFSERPIIDFAGIVSPVAVEAKKTGKSGWILDLLRRERPDFFVERPVCFATNTEWVTWKPGFYYDGPGDLAWLDSMYVVRMVIGMEYPDQEKYPGLAVLERVDRVPAESIAVLRRMTDLMAEVPVRR